MQIGFASLISEACAVLEVGRSETLLNRLANTLLEESGILRASYMQTNQVNHSARRRFVRHSLSGSVISSSLCRIRRNELLNQCPHEVGPSGGYKADYSNRYPPDQQDKGYIVKQRLSPGIREFTDSFHVSLLTSASEDLHGAILAT